MVKSIELYLQEVISGIPHNAENLPNHAGVTRKD
jgi:hypothetical protein